MTMAYWFEQKGQRRVPVQRAALGSCDLSVLQVGSEWQWLVRQAGRDVAEGAARAAVDAQRQAETVALKLLRGETETERSLQKVESLVPPRDKLEFDRGLFPVSAKLAAENRAEKRQALLKESPARALAEAWAWLEEQVWRRASDQNTGHSAQAFEEAACRGGLSNDQITALRELHRLRDRVDSLVFVTAIHAIRFADSTERLIAQMNNREADQRIFFPEELRRVIRRLHTSSE
jgi:hypothetical protein